MDQQIIWPTKRIRREFYRLVLARSDVTMALFIIKYLLSEFPNTMSKYEILRDKRYIPLQEAIVVSYSRPFTGNMPLGRLPSKWSEFQDEEMIDTHNQLIKHRHTRTAHSDAAAREVELVPESVEIKPLGKHHGLAITISNQSFSISFFEKAERLCLYLGGTLNSEIENMQKIHFDNLDLPKRTVKLPID